MVTPDRVTPGFSALGRRASPPTIAKLMSMALENPGLLSLAAGFTDNTTLPKEIVADVACDLANGADAEFLQYGTNQGRPKLRHHLGQRLSAIEPDLNAGELADAMMVTNGSQQALYLAVQTLCDPGDIVLVDRPSYFVFLEMLTGLGIEARSIPVDQAGAVDGAALEGLLDQIELSGDLERLRAVYFVSYFSNPSARSLSLGEKETIAAALTRKRLNVPILEDAAYRELYFDQPHPVPSILSIRAFDSFPKLYLSTLTKPFATGLKVGYAVCSDEAWLKKMLHVKGHQDFGTANFNQAIFQRVFEKGAYAPHLTMIRTAYREKRDALHEALEAGKLDKKGWLWVKPDGGLYIWVKAPRHIDTRLDSEFCRRCVSAGVVFVPGDLCFGDAPPTNYARLSFGVLSVTGLREAGSRFCQVASLY